ncbi:MAG: GWxTD domain-containing protein, partial [Flavobacteriales bacterium]
MSTLRLLLPCLLASLALPAIAAVDAFVETKTFYANAQQPIVGIHFAFNGASAVHLANERGFLQARIEALTIIQKDGNILDFRKTVVQGPERLDEQRNDFLHTETFQLAPGTYDLYFELRDMNSADTTIGRFSQPLVVAAPGTGLFFSDVELVERFESAADGSGSIPVPYLGTYYPPEVDVLNFHAEVYAADKVFGADSLYLLSWQLEVFEDKKVFGNYKGVKRVKASASESLMSQFDIGSLPSGNYLLALEVRGRSGELQGRKELFFQRNNPISYDLQSLDALAMRGTFADAITDVDTLVEHINSMRPIAQDLERKIIDDRTKDRDPALMQRFLYGFWFNRNGYAPEQAWEAYRKEVAKVNALYGCRNRPGYTTDQGIIRLKYGMPNSVADQPMDNDGYPYQVWHYYRCGNYSDRRFIFY